MTAVAEHRTTVRANCAGVVPLTGRLEQWMADLLADPVRLAEIVTGHGSPVNLLDVSAMARNAGDLAQAAQRSEVDLRIFFARKANKALAFVDEARRLGMGVDLASEVELDQVLRRGIDGSELIMTAAVKPAGLLRRCLESGTTVAIDNADELVLLDAISRSIAIPGEIALRIAPDLGPGRAETRFGLAPEALQEALRLLGAEGSSLRVGGVHFHLDGYTATDRVTAIEQALALVTELRAQGQTPRFIDIGGGVPMSYLDDASEWERFWTEHRRALDGEREALTFGSHPLTTVYPYHQQLVRGSWLELVLGAQTSTGSTVSERLIAEDLQLRCEPGRSLLDGCGMTVARVEFRKQRRDGTWLIGLAMNRTQCRSTSDDFMVDPLLVAAAGRRTEPAIDGYLVGAYCIERELLTLRQMRFPNGVAVGDLIVFPNTAGYLMHILESTSHQIPLAKNLVVSRCDVRTDDIDGWAGSDAD